MKTKHQDIGFEMEDMFRECDAGGRREYNKVHKHITIVIEFSGNPGTEAEQLVSSSDETTELRPTTDEIFRRCPQFRILVIGKTGVGKSTLINKAFGVQNATVSHDKPGEVSIERGLVSPQNNKFVLHDSKGFEPGEEDNLKIVQDFINRRRAETDLKDQLHAVWLCFEIPCTGGRLLETGVEQFLTSKRKGELGDIPIVVVFTKYDQLLVQVERTTNKSSFKGLSEAAIQDFIKTGAEDKLQEVCIAPLEKFAKSAIPYVTVSTNGKHKETLARLIQTTEELVCKHVGADASVMTFVAQRVDHGLNIDASITVGKRRYWKALASSPTFKNCKTWDCLQVLHADIVNVWNFYDPDHHLRSDHFKGLMVQMVDELEVGPTANPTKTITIGLSMVGTIAGIMAALAGPAAPIVVPIAAGAVLAAWVYTVYQISHVALQRFMSYIDHLTLVFQTLYLVSESQEKLTRRVIKLAVASYLASPISDEVHSKIKDYVLSLNILELADRNSLDKIVEVMQLYTIDAAEMSELRKKIPHVGLLPDELW